MDCKESDTSEQLSLHFTQEMQVSSLSREDALEKGTATQFGILAWEIPRTEQPGGLVHGVAKESDTTQQLNNNTIFKYYHEQIRDRQVISLHKLVDQPYSG